MNPKEWSSCRHFPLGCHLQLEMNGTTWDDRKTLRGKKQLHLLLSISETFVPNIMIIVFFFFESFLKLSLCQQHSFYSSGGIDYCPEGMFSLPQSKGEKQIEQALKIASQASLIHRVARVREMNSWR